MKKYIAMVLLGGACYGILSTFVKIAYKEGYNSAEIAFTQAFSGAIILWLLAYFRKGENISLLINRQVFVSLLLTGATIGLTTFLYYLSVQYIPASIAIILLMQFTWFGVLIEWVIFRKKTSPAEMLVIVVILFGTTLAGDFHHFKSSYLPLKGVLLVLASSLVYAIYIVANSRVGKIIPWQNKSAIIMTGSAIAIFLINLQPIITESHIGFGLLKWALFLAFFGTIIPPVLFAIAIPKIGSAKSAILMTIELPVAVLCAYLVLKESLRFTQILGIIIMIIAIVSMSIYKNRHE